MKTIDIIKPDIYDRFQCKGAACRKTCCTGWRIGLNKAEYQDLKEKLKTNGTKLLRRLTKEERSSLIYGEFILKDETGCSLQSDEGLCSLQLVFGEKALPDICATFPRKGIRCDSRMQVALTPACECVVELLLEKEDALEFICQNEPLPRLISMNLNGKGAKARWNHYIQLQEFCILLLQAEDVSLNCRMALLGAGLYQIDAYYKSEEVYKVSSYIDRYLSVLSGAKDVESLVFPESSMQLNPSFLLGSLLSAPVFSDTYQSLLNQVLTSLQVKAQAGGVKKEVVFSYSTTEYEKRRKLYNQFTRSHPFFMENIMVMLFVLEHWASLPGDTHSIWDQYMYACWVYSSLQFVLTACIEDATSDQDLIDICVTLFRNWIHNEQVKEKTVQHLHETGTDTPAHLAMLVQAG